MPEQRSGRKQWFGPGSYAAVPTTMFPDDLLFSECGRVWLALVHYAKAGGIASATLKQLKTDTKMHRRSVQRGLARLIVSDRLRVIQDGVRGTATEYQLVLIGSADLPKADVRSSAHLIRSPAPDATVNADPLDPQICGSNGYGPRETSSSRPADVIVDSTLTGPGAATDVTPSATASPVPTPTATSAPAPSVQALDRQQFINKMAAILLEFQAAHPTEFPVLLEHVTAMFASDPRATTPTRTPVAT